MRSRPFLRSSPVSVTAPVDAVSVELPWCHVPVMFGPNITGNLTDVVGGAGMSFNGGALTGDITDNPRVFGTTGIGRFASITLQAKRSSDAYGNSTTVQPPSMTALVLIKF